MLEIAPSISTQGASIVQNVVTLLPQSVQSNPDQLQMFKYVIIAAVTGCVTCSCWWIQKNCKCYR